MSSVTAIRDDDARRPQPTSRLAAHLGALLLATREARGISRRSFAAGIRSGHWAASPGATIAPGSLREIELGTTNPTLSKVEEMAALYGVDVDIVITARDAKAS
jgi:transcriptional regulator with XRE-family HTH domain